MKGRKEKSFRQLLLFFAAADFSEQEASLLTSCKEENARTMEMNAGKAITLQKGQLSMQNRCPGENTGAKGNSLDVLLGKSEVSPKAANY